MSSMIPTYDGARTGSACHVVGRAGCQAAVVPDAAGMPLLEHAPPVQASPVDTAFVYGSEAGKGAPRPLPCHMMLPLEVHDSAAL